MTKTEIFDKTRSIIAEVLRIDEAGITLQNRLKEDLGATSLDQVTLLMAFEDEFKEEISDEEAATLLTVEDTVKFINSKFKIREQTK